MLEMMLEIKAEMKLMAKSISVIQKKMDTSQSVLADSLPEDISLPISNAEELKAIEKNLEVESCRQNLVCFRN